MSKLNFVVVGELRSRKQVRGSMTSWAKEFSVSRRAIRFALDGATWA